MRVSSFVVRRPSVIQTVVRPSVVVVRRSSRPFVVCRPSNTKPRKTKIEVAEVHDRYNKMFI